MRALLRRAFAAALEAVDARRATADALAARPIEGRVDVVALGKAAIGMSAGALEACDVTRGLVIAPRGIPSSLPASFEVLAGAHPVPDDDVARRGETMLAWAASIPESATALVLVSGGGSALVDAPREGVTAGELGALTARLLASGARIDEINALRVALSRSKGGGLAAAIRARSVRVLVISDVVGGDAALVASGPMSPWRGPSPREVAERPHVRAVLTERERALAGAWQRATAPSAELEVVADNARAVDAAARALRDEGHVVDAGPALIGEARACGALWARAADETTADALVSGGETVVTLRGRGRGGRNQETALAALHAGIAGTFLCAGTDGIDGPTDAAGAIVDEAVSDDDAVMARALDDNDSYGYLARRGGLLVTGPTGTNVADLAIWARGRGASR